MPLGSAYNWWLRSVYSSSNFCNVNSDGSWNNNNASNTYLPCAGLRNAAGVMTKVSRGAETATGEDVAEGGVVLS